ncbi:MAG: helix-turn-helix domain-containing protein [Deltaproteobacteria bacterium]|nr:helix-turn-helix domain-containing protein [Deltaproteobacteria bacterium]
MATTKGRLAEKLRKAIQESNVSVDELAARTKIPRSTIRALLDEPVSALLPERVYLRGHLSILARELEIDVRDTQDLFELENPEPRTIDVLPPPRFSPNAIAVAAAIGGIAVFLIVLVLVV